MKKQKMFSALFFLLLAGLLFSCKEPETEDPETGNLKVQFSFMVDDETLIMDTMAYVNAAGNRYEVNEIKFFISDVYLHKANGDSIKVKHNNSVHYVDYDIPETLLWSITDEIPQGSYSAISFTFGISPDKNISNAYVNPPESNMAWPAVLGGGYHYMMINGKWQTDTTNSVFHFHTGIGQIREGETITGFVHNNFNVQVPNSGFVISESPALLNISMNINSWFTSPHDYDFNYWGGGIMQNQDAQVVIRDNGWDVFSIKN